MATVLPSCPFFLPPIWLVVAWLAGQAWQPFSPFGSHNNCSFEDETSLLVAFFKETFYWVRGLLCLCQIESCHTHPLTRHHRPTEESALPCLFVSVASGSASGSCSDGASGCPCLVIREPEHFSCHRGPFTWPGPRSPQALHLILSGEPRGENSACFCDALLAGTCLCFVICDPPSCHWFDSGFGGEGVFT